MQAAKIIGTGMATTGLTGAGIGIGVVLQTILKKSYNNLHWNFTSPPKAHAFVNLALQSNMPFIKYVISKLYPISLVIFPLIVLLIEFRLPHIVFLVHYIAILV